MSVATDVRAGTGPDADVGTTTDLQTLRRQQAWEALGTVMDPELDEPVTDLGFVCSLVLEDPGVTVHLRLPTSFCSPNFAYLMVSDAKDALRALPWVGHVVVELDDHHDSDLINAGLAADAGYRGTFRHEAENDLDELRATFRRKAHTAAMERCLSEVLRAAPSRPVESLVTVTMADLPPGRTTDALLRRRQALGLPCDGDSLVMVDHEGVACSTDDAPLRMRLARATRVSIDGNAHFCRGLLATRYPGAEADQVARPEGAEPGEPGQPAFVPLSALTLPRKEHLT